MNADRIDFETGQLLSLGFRASSVAQLLVDDTARIVQASTGAGRVLNRAPEDLKGLPLAEFIFPPPDVAQFKQRAIERQGKPFELELQPAGGGLIPVVVHCDIFSVADGPTYCMLVFDDMTREKVAERERAARLAKLSLLNQVSQALHGTDLTLDRILEAFLICVTAGQGLRFNRAFLLLIDEHEQVLQGEIAIGPSNRDEASRIWNDLADRQLDLFQMMTSYDHSLKQTDVAVNEIVKNMGVPLGQEDHILIRAMRERKPYRVRGDSDQPGLEIMRLWLGVPSFAVAPLTTRRGPLGVIVADNAITGHDISDLDLEFLQLFANASASAIENSRLYRELERRLVDLRKAALRQKRDQETLLRMERLSVMGETSAIVAHELRNPLVAIGGFARTLQRSLPKDDPNQRFAAIITEEVGRLERIIHDLLDFIRPQKLLRKLVILDELAEETVRRYEERILEQQLTLVLDLQASETRVNCNPGEIQQVLQNLVLNAIQVFPDGGPGIIEIRTRQLEGGVQVEVLDTGPGLSKELEDKIFAPFFTTKSRGSGLGLTICTQIIKAHGGVLRARHRQGGGACFTFILPLPKSQPPAEDSLGV